MDLASNALRTDSRRNAIPMIPNYETRLQMTEKGRTALAKNNVSVVTVGH